MRFPQLSWIFSAALLSQCSSPRVLLPNLSPVQQRAMEGVYPAGHESILTDELIRAENAWDAVNASSEAFHDPALQAAYRDTVTAFIKTAQDIVPPTHWKNGKVFVNERAKYRVEFEAADSSGELPVEWFHKLEPTPLTQETANEGLVGNGMGAPLNAVFYRTKDVEKVYPMVPTIGARLPATAVLEFTGKISGDGSRIVKLHLRDTFESKIMSLRGRKVPLAYNYRVPLTDVFEDRYWLKMSMIGFFRPSKIDHLKQFYRIRGHSPKRIPLVLVHGLNSDPHIWKNAVEAVMADDKLRAIYEPMCFAYPTGLPVMKSAASLRRAMSEGLAALDPEGDDPGMRHIIIVGHSMGGLLSRLQTIDSGMTFWNSYFLKSPAQLKVSERVRNSLERSLIFKRNQNITRAIFIATPHRGSRVADFSIVRWLGALIKLPQTVVTTATELIHFNGDAINPQMMAYAMYPVSIGTMAPGHPFFKAFAEFPPSIPFHSIIARTNVNVPLEESTDGAVPYISSHLEGAQSELVVPSWHSCVQKPAVVQEIRRILYLHAKASGYDVD